MSKSYQYQPTSGPLTGISFELQTTQFLADAASRAEWGNVANRPDVENLLGGVNQQLSSLDARSSATEQLLTTAQSSVAANTQAIGELQKGAAAARADIDRLKARADSTDKAAAELQERVGKAESSIIAAQTSIEVVQAQANATDASLSASQGEIASLQARADATDLSLDAAHGEAASAIQAAAIAQSTADAAQNAADAAYGAANTAQGSADAAQNTADAAQNAVNTLLPLVVAQGLIALCNGEPPAGWVLCDGDNGTPDLGAYATGPLRYIQFSGPPHAPVEPQE